MADAPLTAVGQTVRADAGVKFSGSVATFSDLNPKSLATDFTANLTWPDGTKSTGALRKTGPGAFEVSGDFLFKRSGKYSVAVAIKDVDGATTSTTAPVQVHAAPVTKTSGVAVQLKQKARYAGGLGWFAVAGTTAQKTDYKATIAWGDGTATTGTVVRGLKGRFRVTGGHAYAAASSYSIKVTILNPFDGNALATIKSNATVKAMARFN